MNIVRYDIDEAKTNLEFILEQVIAHTEIIIVRSGIEVARIIATEGANKRGLVEMTSPFERC